MHAEPQYPLTVDLHGEIEGLAFRNAFSAFEPPGGWTDEDDTSTPLVAELVADVHAGRPRTIPLVAAYGTDRAQRTSKKPDGRQPSRTDGYASALTFSASAGAFTAWLRQRTGQGLEAGTQPPDLSAVLGALRHAVPDWNGLRYDFTEDALLATRMRAGEEVDRLPFRLLSDGQRALLGLMCDMAYRCAVLNPHLGEDAVRETPGVVLIDELDLHLHPRWQKTVVDDLREAFPRVQFVATTHSPFIIQGLPPRAVLDLSRPEVAVPGGPVNEPEPIDFRRQSIEDIAETAMRVPNPYWSAKREEWWRAATRYYELLEQHGGVSAGSPEIEDAKRRLDEASIPFADDTGFAAMQALLTRSARPE